jgi:hypothetical protein
LKQRLFRRFKKNVNREKWMDTWLQQYKYTNRTHLYDNYNLRSLNVKCVTYYTEPEAQVRALVSLCGICSGKSGTASGFSPSSLGFSCQYHSTVAPNSYVFCWIKNGPIDGRSSKT